MPEKRVSTGIERLDPLIEGGFRTGKSYLIVGEPGTGKTIFGLQFLYSGLAHSEKALYVAVDQKPADVIEQAESLGWNLGPHIERKELLLLDASGYIKSRVGSSETKADIQKVVLELNHHINQARATRVVIDPLSPLIPSDDSESRVQDHVRWLLYSLHDQAKATTLITSHSGARSVRGIEEYLVAGTIVLEMELEKNRFVRVLTVEKMRSTVFEPAQYVFNIVKGKGIVLQLSNADGNAS